MSAPNERQDAQLNVTPSTKLADGSSSKSRGKLSWFPCGMETLEITAVPSKVHFLTLFPMLCSCSGPFSDPHTGHTLWAGIGILQFPELLGPSGQLASCPCSVILFVCGLWDFLNALGEAWAGDLPGSGGIT